MALTCVERSEILAMFLRPETILPELKSSSRDEAIDELLAHLKRLNVHLNLVPLRSALLQREAQAPTAIGDSIACPHIHTPLVDELKTVIGIAREPIPFDNDPTNDARIIILTLSPSQANSPYMHYITALLSRLQSPLRRNMILSSQEARHIRKLLLKP